MNVLERLLIYLCIHSGGILEVGHCAGALQSTRPTVNNDPDLLEQANLMYRLPPVGVGGKKVLKAPQGPPRGRGAARRRPAPRRGGAVGPGGTRRGRRDDRAAAPHRVRVPRHAPRGVLAPAGHRPRGRCRGANPSYTLPVEVKYRESPTLGAKPGLVAFCREERVTHAYWVTKREDDFGPVAVDGLATKFLRVPAHIFCYLLGQAERVPWRHDPPG